MPTIHRVLYKAYAKLVWCNPKQPRFASVFCKVLKDQGALVLTKKGDEPECLPLLRT